MFLLASNTPKVLQVRVQGVAFFAGAVVLMLAHLRSGLLLSGLGWFSAAMLVPAGLGMLAGQAVQDRLNQDLFRKATLVVMVLAGLNLLRRAYGWG